jgi:hypothetical protein
VRGSPGEEALGEGRDEGDLDQQVNEGFNCCYCGLWVGWLKRRGEEAALMEGRQAYDERFVPGGQLAVRAASAKWARQSR